MMNNEILRKEGKNLMKYYAKIYAHGTKNYMQVLQWIKDAKLTSDYEMVSDDNANLVTVFLTADDQGVNANVMADVTNAVFLPTMQQAMGHGSNFPEKPVAHIHVDEAASVDDHSHDPYVCHFVFGDEKHGDYTSDSSINVGA